MRDQCHLIIYRIYTHLVLWSLSLLAVILVGAPRGLAQEHTAPLPTSARSASLVPTSHSGPPTLTPTSAPHLFMSVDQFERLQRAALREVHLAEWSQTKVSVDLARARSQREVQVQISGVVSGPKSSWVYLIPHLAIPLKVSLNQKAIQPKVRDTHFAVPISTPAATISLTYTARLESDLQGQLSSLIPLPPIPHADVTIKNAPAEWESAPRFPKGTTSAHLALKGALFLTLPPQEREPFIQQQTLNLTIYAPDTTLERGATLLTRLKVNVPHGPSWIKVAPAQDAITRATLNDKDALVRVRDQWQWVLVRTPGVYHVEIESQKLIDRSSGQPELTLSPQKFPLTTLSVTVEGEHELSFDPPVPLRANTIIPRDGDATSASSTQIEAHLPPLETLSLRWAEKRETPEEDQPHYLTETFQLFTLRDGLLVGDGRIEVDVIRGAVKTLSVALPEDVVLYQVKGKSVESWRTLPAKVEIEQRDDQEVEVRSPRRVEIHFGTPQDQPFQLALKWQRVVTQNQPFTLPLISMINAFQQSGVVALYNGARVGFTPAQRSGNFVTTGQEALPQPLMALYPNQKVSQAFRHVKAPGELKTQVTSEQAQALRFDAQVDSLYTVQEDAIRVNAQVLVKLKAGRMDELKLWFPDDCSDPQISGPQINTVERGEAVDGLVPVHVKLTRRFEGALRFQVELEKLIKDQATQLSLPQIKVESAELVRGEIGISVERGLELTPRPSAGLRVMSLDELARSIRLRATSELLFGFRFSRSWTLNADLKRHRVIEIPKAHVSKLSVNTYLPNNGFQSYVAIYSVVNQDRRSFRVHLPKRASLQQVHLDNKPVKARDEDGMLSVLIPQSATSEVKITYEIKEDPITSWSEIPIALPHSDIKVNHVSWMIYHDPSYLLNSMHGPAQRSDSTPHRWSSSTYGLMSLKLACELQYDLLNPQSPPLVQTLTLRPQLPESFRFPLSFSLVLLSFLLGISFVRPESRTLWKIIGIIGLVLSVQLYADWVDFHDHLLAYVISGGIGYLSALSVVAIRRKASQIKPRGPLVSYPPTPYIPPAEADDTSVQTQSLAEEASELDEQTPDVQTPDALTSSAPTPPSSTLDQE